MFFFFDEQDQITSGMAFETYVINVLHEYLKAQSKRILVGAAPNLFDAVLIDGINDIPGPVYLEAKAMNTNKSGYFRTVERFADEVSEMDEGDILLVLGTVFSEASKQGMARMVESRTKRNVYIWDIDDFNKLTDGYGKEYKEFIESPAKAIVDEAINNPTSKTAAATVKDTLISTLKKEYEKEELVLFVGAGISRDAGIPQWNELINALLSKMILSRIKDKDNVFLPSQLNSIIELAYKNQENSPITQMRYIKGAFSPTEYNKLVHEVLYSNKPKANTKILKAIAALCTPGRTHIGVQGVVTYNFDDLLERALKKQKVAINIISTENDITEPGKLTVAHVHGYMPKNFKDNDPDVELIFSEEDYHRVYRDAYCWSNLTQLNYLRERTCLFIGCSLTDPNLRRLLDVARRNDEKPRHFAFLRRSSVEKPEEIDQTALEIYKDIDLTLRERYYNAMGLNIIWVDSFSEIPQILLSLLG